MTVLTRLLKRLTEPLREYEARSYGLFWAPCPVCGEMFSGAEYGRLSVPTGENTSAMACRWCEAEVGETARAMCDRFGHEPVCVWHGRQRTPGHFRFDTGAPSDERYCSVCFIDLPHDERTGL